MVETRWVSFRDGMSTSYTKVRRSPCSLIVPRIARAPQSLWTTPLGSARVNRQQRLADLERAQAELLIKIPRETDDEVDLRASRQRSRLNDPIALRGLPAIGKGVRGAVRGSVPGANLR
jgi:hypothetical protein